MLSVALFLESVDGRTHILHCFGARPINRLRTQRSGRMIQIEEHISLAEHTTFRIGGPARYFLNARSLDDLKEALHFAQEAKLPIFVLGGGSNILISDKGFDGVVIKIDIKGISLEQSLTVAGSGESWDGVVAFVTNQTNGGLENLSGIPGSVGGAVVGNIGAYGKEIKDILEWVQVFDTVRGETKKYSVADCQFSYRNSLFKRDKTLIVLAAAFQQGAEKQRPSVDYPDLLKYFADTPEPLTPRSVRKAVLTIRANKLPDISQVGTAGSFFKNPVVPLDQYTTLKKRYPETPSFPVQDSSTTLKIPAGWLLDKICGFKGKRWGTLGVYDRQALVLVNFGGANAEEVQTHAQEMVDAVKTATGITLEREVEYISA